MEQLNFWPGAYSFKSEIKVLLESFQEQITTVLKKIEEADKLAVSA